MSKDEYIKYLELKNYLLKKRIKKLKGQRLKLEKSLISIKNIVKFYN